MYNQQKAFEDINVYAFLGITDMGLFDDLINTIFDDEWTGRRGEKLTVRELNLVKLLGRKGRTLQNVYLPKNNGETSEIDVMYITQKGIFVFESKNYSGWIFGDEKDQYWTVMLPNKQKNRFYNPIRQNKTHLKWLSHYIGDVPLFSIIVFSERCELKKITVNSPDVKVIKRDYVYATVRNYWNGNPDVLSENDVEELYQKLKPLTDVDAATKATHIDTIKKKYRAHTSADVEAANNSSSETATKIPSLKSEELICPLCGKALILRTAKKGANAGNQFYGCSGFPSCRYTRGITEG